MPKVGMGSLVDDAGWAVDVVAVLVSKVRAPALQHAQAVLEVWQADVDPEEVRLGRQIPAAMPQRVSPAHCGGLARLSRTADSANSFQDLSDRRLQCCGQGLKTTSMAIRKRSKMLQEASGALTVQLCNP